MTIAIRGKSYPVIVSHRATRRIILRFRDEQFYVSLPRRTPKKWLLTQLKTHAETLLLKRLHHPLAFNQDGVFLYGAWMPYPQLSYYFKGAESLPFHYRHPQWNALKIDFTQRLIQRVASWQRQLKITTPYRVRVRHMQTRLGSNSRKTQRLTFAYKLIHFAWPIIDAVIVHELIHDWYFDHSPQFHQALLRAYPTYLQEHDKILKGQYR